jgi:hypothetical protein
MQVPSIPFTAALSNNLPPARGPCSLAPTQHDMSDILHTNSYNHEIVASALEQSLISESQA